MAIPSTRNDRKDQHLGFECHQFSRATRALRGIALLSAMSVGRAGIALNDDHLRFQVFLLARCPKPVQRQAGRSRFSLSHGIRNCMALPDVSRYS